MRGIITGQNKPMPYYSVGVSEARIILTELIEKTTKPDGVDFPRDILFRFHDGGRVEIFEITMREPVMRPICTKDKAKFTSINTPDTNRGGEGNVDGSRR